MNDQPVRAGGHSPVMVSEVVAGLAPRDGGVIIDATFGAGGYARAILDAAACAVIGIDRDPEACERAAAMSRSYAGRLSIVRGRFGAMASLLAGIGIDLVDGVAFDLGVSSPQIDTAERGFSFRLNGPLDMRMDPNQTLSAADVVNGLPEDELAHILATYGEERAARRVARAIVRARTETPITLTGRLAEIVRQVLPQGREKIELGDADLSSAANLRQRRTRRARPWARRRRTVARAGRPALCCRLPLARGPQGQVVPPRPRRQTWGAIAPSAGDAKGRSSCPQLPARRRRRGSPRR